MQRQLKYIINTFVYIFLYVQTFKIQINYFKNRNTNWKHWHGAAKQNCITILWVMTIGRYTREALVLNFTTLDGWAFLNNTKMRGKSYPNRIQMPHVVPTAIEKFRTLLVR